MIRKSHSFTNATEVWQSWWCWGKYWEKKWEQSCKPMFVYRKDNLVNSYWSLIQIIFSRKPQGRSNSFGFLFCSLCFKNILLKAVDTNFNKAYVPWWWTSITRMSWIFQRMLFYYFLSVKIEPHPYTRFNYRGSYHQGERLSSSGFIKKAEPYNFIKVLQVRKMRILIDGI